jgi:hypothetical protein
MEKQRDIELINALLNNKENECIKSFSSKGCFQSFVVILQTKSNIV